MTSSRVPTSAALILGLLLAAPMAFADQKDDVYKKGMDAAINKGDSIGARDAFCALPKDYSDAAAQCATYTDAANRTLTRYKISFSEGNDLMAAGKLDEAAAKFRTIKAGDYAEQAKAKLVDITKLKQQQADQQNQAQQSAAAEQAAKQKLDAGTNAFNSGDFNTAKSVLPQVIGSHQSEAQAVLGKIKAYENAITQGNAFMVGRDYASAKNSFAEAMRINPVGPSNATDLYTKAVTASATASIPTNTPTNTVKPTVPAKQIDISAYLADAQKSIAKRDYKKARRYLSDIFAQDRNNQEAKDALADLNAKDTAVANASDEDSALKDDITLFYNGSYQDAEDRLKFYLFTGAGKKKGLASFYLGATMMTRYYLGGGVDQNLRREAQNKFRDAKAVQGFTAPEKFVSPKIMKAFSEAS